jgi:hypothetical protein
MSRRTGWYTVYTVRNNIPEMLDSRKARDVSLIVIVVALAVVSFGLGRLSVDEQKTVPVALCAQAVPSTAVSDQTTPVPALISTYVASKNSTVYHFPWCSGAKRISDSNRITFKTKEEAEQAGYRPAANCKGL